MSTILDALKQLQRDRADQRADRGDLKSSLLREEGRARAPASRRSASGARLLLLGLVLGLVVAGGGSLYLLTRGGAVTTDALAENGPRIPRELAGSPNPSELDPRVREIENDLERLRKEIAQREPGAAGAGAAADLPRAANLPAPAAPREPVPPGPAKERLVRPDPITPRDVPERPRAEPAPARVALAGTAAAKPSVAKLADPPAAKPSVAKLPDPPAAKPPVATAAASPSPAGAPPAAPSRSGGQAAADEREASPLSPDTGRPARIWRLPVPDPVAAPVAEPVAPTPRAPGSGSTRPSERSASRSVAPTPVPDEPLAALPFPDVRVGSIRWHPDPARREAMILYGAEEEIVAREGDIVLGVSIKRIDPAAVELRLGEVRRLVQIAP